MCAGSTMAGMTPEMSFGEADLDGARGGGADGLDAETMSEDGVVAGGGEIAAGEPEPGGDVA